MISLLGGAKKGYVIDWSIVIRDLGFSDASEVSSRDYENECRLILFVVDNELNSRIAKENFAMLLENGLGRNCQIEIVDILDNFALAAEHKIMVTPTLLVLKEGASIKIIGNLNDREKVRMVLGVDDETVVS